MLRRIKRRGVLGGGQERMHKNGLMVAFLLTASLFWTAPAHAQAMQSCGRANIVAGSNTLVICSWAFGFSGACGKQQPQYPYDGWRNVAFATLPWENQSITIRAVSLDVKVTGNGPLSLGMFSGNNTNPDPMTPYRYFDSTGNVVDGHTESPKWPSNSGMQLPMASPDYALANNGDPRIDAHVDCSPAGAAYQGYLFVWYTKP